MSRFYTFIAPLALLIALVIFSAAPVLRDLYGEWRDSNEREWRIKWNEDKRLREEAATKLHSVTKIVSNTQNGPRGPIDVRTQYKAVDFNRVAFIVNVSPVDEDFFRVLAKDSVRGDSIIYLSLRDSDEFRLDEIGLSNPKLNRNENGEIEGMEFEIIRDIEFSVLDKIQSFTVSSSASYD